MLSLTVEQEQQQQLYDIVHITVHITSNIFWGLWIIKHHVCITLLRIKI